MYKIIKKVNLNHEVDLMEIEAENVARHAKAGNFIILRVDEVGERVPLTVAYVDGNNVAIVYQKLGYSTKLLGTLNVGDSVEDFAGPLGKPAHIDNVDRVLGIAGGVGSAPLLPQLKAYKEKGTKVDLIIGGRTKAHLILVDFYEKFCDNIYFATNDGSAGTKGFVTDVLNDLLKKGEVYDKVITIGPLIMMKSVVAITEALDIDTDVSLNPIMIDGTGMCGNCRVTINGETKFACIDGPDFNSKGIDFDELMDRQTFYKEEENHTCNIGLDKHGK